MQLLSGVGAYTVGNTVVALHSAMQDVDILDEASINTVSSFVFVT